MQFIFLMVQCCVAGQSENELRHFDPACEAEKHILATVTNKMTEQGALSTTYLGKTPDGKKVVIKVLADESGQLQREIEMYKFLESKKTNLFPKFYGHGKINKKSCIVMEYIKGGDLIEYINSHSLSFADLKMIISRVLQGLKVLHQYGWAHRDLKPDNLMLMDKNDLSTLKIMDFGLSKQLSEQPSIQRIHSNVGTPSYAACEVVQTAKYGVGVDVFSLGKMIVMILTMGLPLERGTFMFENFCPCLESLQKCSYRYKRSFQLAMNEVKELDKHGQDFVLSTLSFDALKRPTVGELLKHPWLTGRRKLWRNMRYI